MRREKRAGLPELPELELEEAALDGHRGMSPRHLLNIITALAIAAVLAAGVAANFRRLFPPPPFTGQNIYVDFGEKIEALDAQTGRVRWTAPMGNELIAVSAGMLIGVQTIQGLSVFALDAVTGAVRWHTHLGNAIPCVPGALMVADGLALVSCVASNIQGERVAQSGKLHEYAAFAGLVAIDLARGGVRWRFLSHQAAALTVAVAGNNILVGEQAETNAPDLWLYALDARTGVTQWRSSAGGPITQLLYDPASDTVLAQAQDLTSFTSDGAVLWRDNLILADPPLVAQGIAFIPTFEVDQPVTLAIDLRTGAQRWRFPTQSFPPAAPLVTPMGYLIIDTLDTGSSSAVLLNPRAGTPQWQVPVPNGTVIAGAEPGSIFLMDDTTFSALDALHGTVRWRLALPATLASFSAPTTLVTTKDVIIAGNTAILAADAATGKLRWQVKMPAALTLPPLVGS
jgi:outer membrane protein assembly factor BamB